MSLTADDSAHFGFASERWFEILRTAETRPTLGRLGPYELLAEAGRGGQGVVFRARQPGTGREVAVKRLLAGAFAAPETLRRFEREVEIAAALNHPGIVTVYGVDLVEGAPLLAMEWVDGAPVTRWAAGRPRREVLEVFLRVCEAVQHAHQRGVLHRDLKPSNVIVDAAGHPRVLDFGLAKLSSDSQATLTTSGAFLGTPAYAAPEQWRGEELDVRADVYSLGAILFELVTGRRVIEGEGLEAVARAVDPSPPRPSALVRSIPRELDAITLQALASEREQRSQSLDAFASDVRRFLAGEPVSAHPPGAAYLLRKLVARNRVASALVVLLVGATLVYAVLTAWHADQLGGERDRALLAGQAEARAHAQTERERERTELALARADEERRRAEEERANVERVLEFFATDLMREADPQRRGREPSLSEILRTSASKVDGRFRDAPLVAARVHRMLGTALAELGQYPEAEAEMRAALALDPEPAAIQLARDETQLGTILRRAGRYDEAERILRGAVARHEALESPDRTSFASALDDLAVVLGKTSRGEEALPLLERALEVAELEAHRAILLSSMGVILLELGRHTEARARFEQALPLAIEHLGEDSTDVATVRGNLAILEDAAGNHGGAAVTLRRSLEVALRTYGPEHPRTAEAMAQLAHVLVSTGELEEAEDLARSALAILLPSDRMEIAFLHTILGCIAMRRGDAVAAEPFLAEAMRAFGDLGHRHNFQVAAESLYWALDRLQKHDEIETLLARVLDGAEGRDRAWAFGHRGKLLRVRGDLDGAVESFEEAVAILAPLPAERALFADVLGGYAQTLRALGDVPSAEELEREAAALGD